MTPKYKYEINQAELRIHPHDLAQWFNSSVYVEK